MNHANHHKIVELAIPSLPPASRAIWQPLAGQIVATCMLPDQVAIPLLNGEAGPWRHYFPPTVPKHSFEKLGTSARDHFFDLRFYVDQVLESLRHGNLAEACRFLGVLSHQLGDFGEPAHYYERDITLLLPPPPDRRNGNPHRLLEDTPSTIARLDHAPQVLGDTPASIVMRLEGRLRDLYETTLATILPMLAALYRDDHATAARHADRPVGATAAVFADLLHTFACLHADTWTAAERQTLDSCRLDTLEPAAYDVEFNYGCRPLRHAVTIDQVGHALPLQLRQPAANGTTSIQPVEGLCVVPHALPIAGTRYLAAIDFDLPPEFTRFSVQAGLLAGFQPQAVCRFAIEVDGQTMLETTPRQEADPAVDLDLTVAGGTRLRLLVHTDGSTDKLAFPIWANPTIHRQATARNLVKPT